ncbi:MAG TPA: ABC transporter permease [Tenuifilaceae bacterium]|nr:ABC transporter permease [Bacteroidales bacterium]HNT41322.1 ABC transporter permease [Tenuifilaceae bacterium]MBP8642952.1 ABC transporter permease [Bacteroidales bacterium]NLI87163.1 ABC transporter permease [Bacteroidales bacterium]HNY08318.1 ABC transporter permease [Tenuifilaceae bacterium]
MKQMFLILQREFMTRVRKKSFIFTTLLSPLFFAAMVILPTYFATMEDTEVRNIAVIDNTQHFGSAIPQTEYIKITTITDTPAEKVKNSLEESGYYALLTIDSLPGSIAPALTIYSPKQPSIEVISHIENSMEKEIETRKLMTYNIQDLDKILKDVKTKVNVRSIKISKDGEEKESNTLITMGIAYILSFLMYMMVMLMGNQVMQGVIEEKNNRVVELLVSSVKPVQLMMGKIFGIAAVGLLQIAIWIVLTAGLAGVGLNLISEKSGKANMEQVQIANQSIMANQGAQSADVTAAISETNTDNFLQALKNQNYGLIIGGFIFFFLMGYLLYAAMYAAVGSAVENVSDTQQLVMPITIPLILAIFVMIVGIKSPDGSLAFWFSMIPFTSPIVMLTRLPFGVPVWQLILSAALLIGTFAVTVWLAAKIYRVGILMYGKKYSWKEMIKWIRYRS